VAESTSERLVRNTALNMAGRAWQIALGVVITPYIVRRVGIERYGLWAVMAVFVGYVGLLDFGIRDAFGKFIADSFAAGDDRELNRVINSGLLFYLLLGLAVCGLGLCLIDPILDLFRIPDELRSEGAFLCAAAIITFAVSNAANAFHAIPWGMQRMGVCNAVDVALTVPYVIGLVGLLESGFGIRGVGLNAAIMAILGGLVRIVVASRLLPQLTIRPWRASREALGKLIRFGLKRWLAHVEDVVTYQTDKLLIARFLSVPLVGQYQLGYSLTSRARELPALLTSAVVPAVASLEAASDRKRVVQIYVEGTRYLVAAALPLMALLFATADVVMVLWMGAEYERSALVVRLLAVAFSISATTGCLSAVAIGVGRPDFQAKAGAGQAVLNLGLSVWLIFEMGFPGVVVATVISTALSSAYIIVRFNQYLGYSVLGFCARTLLRPAGAAVLCACGLLALNAACIDIGSLTRWKALQWLMPECAGFAMLYVALLVTSRALSWSEAKALWRKLLPMGSEPS